MYAVDAVLTTTNRRCNKGVLNVIIWTFYFMWLLWLSMFVLF